MQIKYKSIIKTIDFITTQLGSAAKLIIVGSIVTLFFSVVTQQIKINHDMFTYVLNEYYMPTQNIQNSYINSFQDMYTKLNQAQIHAKLLYINATNSNDFTFSEANAKSLYQSKSEYDNLKLIFDRQQNDLLKTTKRLLLITHNKNKYDELITERSKQIAQAEQIHNTTVTEMKNMYFDGVNRLDDIFPNIVDFMIRNHNHQEELQLLKSTIKLQQSYLEYIAQVFKSDCRVINVTDEILDKYILENTKKLTPYNRIKEVLSGATS